MEHADYLDQRGLSRQALTKDPAQRNVVDPHGPQRTAHRDVDEECCGRGAEVSRLPQQARKVRRVKQGIDPLHTHAPLERARLFGVASSEQLDHECDIVNGDALSYIGKDHVQASTVR